ncbi:hypothetical protein AB0C06_23275 [Micromonospora inaquosa]|jgi:hypothetical protein|uniref:DUF3558 domain-containing protein n=1 Tax=Micromonospora inaquosa TaxID=2203716 RepID=A0A3N9WCL5_9ACTN|nr:hypothetical protein [Micromonospora inaquosa]RQW98663.1 hypothetical protein DLJ59_26705 [Micromonospora inaquosa]
MTHLAPVWRRGGGALAAAAVLTLAGLGGCALVGGADDDGDSPVAGVQPSGAATPDGEPSAEPEQVVPATAAVDACTLLTRQEAEKLAGTRLEEPTEKPAPDRSSCTYTGPLTGPTAQVEVYVGDGAKKFLDIDRELGHTLTPISGVGDESYAEDGTVFVNKGGLWACVRLVRTEDPAVYRKALESAAGTVAGRL